MAIATKIGCAPQMLNEWVKKVEVDSGLRGGVMTEKMRTLEREVRELKQANDIFRNASAYFAHVLTDARMC